MSEDGFYLTLPSNAGQNTNPSSFRINLPQNIHLTGEWEVGLVEFMYPKSWYNVRSDPLHGRIFTLEVDYEQTNDGGKKSAKTLHNLHVPAGYYNRAEDLLLTMHKTVPESWKPGISFSYDSRSHRVCIQAKKPISNIYLSDDLMYMLGYSTENNPFSLNRTADHPPDMSAGISVLYVYCDVVEHNVVGDKLAPLLRAVAVEGEFGSIVNKIFVAPHYVPVLKKNFSSIEIDIKSDENKSLDLHFGKTLVKMHFRRKNNSTHL